MSLDLFDNLSNLPTSEISMILQVILYNGYFIKKEKRKKHKDFYLMVEVKLFFNDK